MVTKLRTNGDKTIEHPTIKAKLGVTNKKNHSTFYFEGSTFVKPHEETDYEELFEGLKRKCRKSLKDKLLIHPNISQDFLLNMEMCTERMQKDKNTFLSFQYHFKQKAETSKSILDVKNENESFFTELLNVITDYLSENNITTSKKKS